MYLPRLTGNQCAHRERWDFDHPTLARRDSFFDDRFSQKCFIDREKTRLKRTSNASQDSDTRRLKANPGVAV